MADADAGGQPKISVPKALELIDRALNDVIDQLGKVQAQAAEIAALPPGGGGDITNHIGQ